MAFHFNFLKDCPHSSSIFQQLKYILQKNSFNLEYKSMSPYISLTLPPQLPADITEVRSAGCVGS